ncbi:MAG TPA: nucleotide disphospho-sugar-binding domain-containing protein [Streptosporangiaceae bacterium]
MRALFVTWAVASHFHPMVPLGWALRAAGHDVLVASHPAFAPAITRTGLPALPTGPDIDVDAAIRAEHEIGRWWERRTPAEISRADRGLVGLQAPRRSAEVMAGDLAGFARSWRPDLVIFEPTAFAGPLVARVLGVPAVRHLWNTDFTAGLSFLEDRLLGELAGRFGLPGIGILGDLTLDPCPPGMPNTGEMPRQPIRYVPYNGTAVLPGWLRAPPARRRVCVTWGTSLSSYGGPGRIAHVPRVVRGLAGTDTDIVVAVLESHRAMFDRMPANVISIGPVPLHLLLPSCDAVIHQGGAGALMTALACGVPQLIVPTMPDQIFDAEQVQAAGAGRYLAGGEAVTQDEVAREMRLLLGDPGYRDAARRLQAEALAMPSPADVVAVLERLAAGQGR